MRLGGTWAFWIKLALGVALAVVLYLLLRKGWAAIKSVFGFVGDAAGAVGRGAAAAVEGVKSFTPGLHEAGPAEVAAIGFTGEGPPVASDVADTPQPLGRLSRGEFQTPLTPQDYADLSNPYAYP